MSFSVGGLLRIYKMVKREIESQKKAHRRSQKSNYNRRMTHRAHVVSSPLYNINVGK